MLDVALKQLTTPAPGSKRHKVLEDLDAQLRGTNPEPQEFDVLGHKFSLGALSNVEERWADSKVGGENFYQTSRGRRLPYVAAAIRAVDGVPAADLWKPSDDMPDIQKKLWMEDSEYRDLWYREQAYAWLLAREKNGPFVQMLYHCYLELEERRGQAYDAMDPSSKRLRTGLWSSTSSPEKESSSATPASPG